MPSYRLWPATDGPASSAGDPDNYTLGVEFYVTSAARFIAWHWWAQTAGIDCAFALWQIDGPTSGTNLATLSGQGADFTAGQWNRVQAESPIELIPNQRYRATITSITDGFYSATGVYWTGGGPGTDGITNGLLVAPNTTNATNGAQGAFVGSSVPTFPTSGFNATNYWIDLEVSDDAVSESPWKVFDGTNWNAANVQVIN